MAELEQKSAKARSTNKRLEHCSAPACSDDVPGGVVTLPIAVGTLTPPRTSGISMKVSPHAHPAAEKNGRSVDPVSSEVRLCRLLFISTQEQQAAQAYLGRYRIDATTILLGRAERACGETFMETPDVRGGVSVPTSIGSVTTPPGTSSEHAGAEQCSRLLFVERALADFCSSSATRVAVSW